MLATRHPPAGPPGSDVRRHLLADNQDKAPRQGNAAFHGRPMLIGQIFHLQQLEFGEEAAQWVVEGVLE